MFQDNDLDRLTIDELRELAALFQIQQIVKHLNKRAMQRKTIGSAYDTKVIRFKSRFEAYSSLSEEYKYKERSIGPSSWFYEFISKNPWKEYIDFIQSED